MNLTTSNRILFFPTGLLSLVQLVMDMSFLNTKLREPSGRTLKQNLPFKRLVSLSILLVAVVVVVETKVLLSKSCTGRRVTVNFDLYFSKRYYLVTLAILLKWTISVK